MPIRPRPVLLLCYPAPLVATLGAAVVVVVEQVCFLLVALY